MKKSEKVLLTIIIIIIATCLFADVTQFGYYQSGDDSFLLDSSSFIITIFTTLLATSLTFYIFLIEVLRNYYPKKLISNYIKYNFSFLLFILFINFVLCILISLIRYDFFYTLIVIDLLFIFSLVLIINVVIKKNKYNLLWKDELINSIGYKLKIITENDEFTNIDTSSLEKELKKLESYYFDAINKNQNFIIKEIISTSKKYYKFIIKNKGNIIIEESEDKYNDILLLMNTYLDKLYVYSKFGENKIYNKYIIKFYIEIYKYCYKTNDLSSVKSIDDFLEEYFKDYNNKECDIFSIYMSFTLNIIQKNEMNDKCRNWLDYINQLFLSLINISFIYSNYKNVKHIIQFYFLIILQLSNNGDEYYDLKKIYDSISISINRMQKFDKDESNYINSILIPITDKINKLNNKNIIRDYILFLDNLIKISINNNKYIIIKNISLCLNEINNFNNSDIKDEVYNLKKNILIYLISNNDNYAIFSLQNYEFIFKISEDNSFKSYMDDILLFITKTINIKNIEILINILEFINQHSENFNKNDKNKQSIIFNIYYEAIKKSIKNKNYNSLNILNDYFIKLINYYDNNNKISKNLIIHVIDNLSIICSYWYDKTEIIERILIILDSIINTKYIAQNTEHLELIISRLKDMALSCIEEENNDLLKEISNFLGWIGKSAIVQKNNSILKNVLKVSCEIINIYTEIYTDNNITTIFLGTLFLVLGAIARNYSLSQFEDCIITATKDIKNKDFFKHSKNLRQYSYRSDNGNLVESMGGEHANKNVNAIFYKIIS